MKQINLQKIQNKLRNKFLKAGVKMLGATPSKLGGDNYLTVYRDPDGNFIELIGAMKK